MQDNAKINASEEARQRRNARREQSVPQRLKHRKKKEDLCKSKGLGKSLCIKRAG